MLLHDHEIAGIRDKVTRNEEPWASAYAQVMRTADAALGQEPLSILDAGYNSRYFKQDSVYVPGQDGVKNPASNMKAMKLITTVTRCCLHLGTAWQFTGERRYADKALQLIHAWTLNKATYMMPFGLAPEGVNPGLRPCGEVVVFLSFLHFFEACAVLEGYAGWEPTAKAAVKEWVGAMLEPNRGVMFHDGYVMYNNWEDSRLLFLCNGALFTGDDGLLAYVFDRWRETIPLKMTGTGELPRETERTRSITYTVKALRETAEIAETARYRGTDLYDYTADGKNMRLALDYLTRGLLDISTWPHPMLDPVDKEFMGSILFELAYSRWRDPAYLHVIERYGLRNNAANARNTLLYADR